MTYTGEGGIPDIRDRIYREKGTVALDSAGKATVTLVHPLPAAGSYFVLLTPWIAAGTAPVVANPITLVTSGGNVTGFTIEASRMRALPGTLTLLSQLLNYPPWLASSAAGVRIDWMLF